MTKKTLADYTDTDALDPTKRLAEKYGGYPVRDDIPHINDDHGNEFLDPPRDEPWPEDEYPRRIGVWSIRDPSYPDLTKTAWYNTAVTSQQRDFPLEWVGASWHAHVRPARYFLLAHTSNGTDNEPETVWIAEYDGYDAAVEAAIEFLQDHPTGYHHREEYARSSSRTVTERTEQIHLGEHDAE